MWKVGTKRIVGILAHDDDRDARFPSLPPEVAKKLSFEAHVYGDFLVCPFTKERPGWMQFVCVDSGKNLIVSERK